MIKFIQTLIQFVILLWAVTAVATTSQEIQIEKIQYGTSFESRPLSGFKIYRQGPFLGRKVILLTEGVHGNEYLGHLDKLIETSDNGVNLPPEIKKFVSSGGIVLLVPKVNPDGVFHKSRHSRFGIDLNRDFKMSQVKMQESRMLVQWIDQELQQHNANLVLSVDYHCCGGGLLHPENESSERDQLFQRHYKDISQIMKTKLNPEYRLGKSEDFFGKKNLGTLKDYWFEKYGAISFTFEAESMQKEAAAYDKHLAWWESLAQYVAKIPTSEVVVMSNNALETDPKKKLDLENAAYSE